MCILSCLIAGYRRPKAPKEPVINAELVMPNTSLSSQGQPALNNPPHYGGERITRTRAMRKWSRHQVVMVGSNISSHEISDVASLSVASSASTNITAFSYLSVDPACQEMDVTNAPHSPLRAPRLPPRPQWPLSRRTSCVADNSHFRQIRKLGSGAEGGCFLMEHETTKELVVVKRMKRQNMVSRFRRDFFP